jgi:hypothetical protein
MVKQRTENIQNEMEGMEYEHCKKRVGNLYKKLLRTILEDCIQQREEVLGPMKYTRRPVLRRAQIKGHQMTLRHSNKERYFLAQPTYTVGFKDSNSNIRDYFVIFFQRVMKDRLPLILYMGKQRYSCYFQGKKRTSH